MSGALLIVGDMKVTFHDGSADAEVWNDPAFTEAYWSAVTEASLCGAEGPWASDIDPWLLPDGAVAPDGMDEPPAAADPTPWVGPDPTVDPLWQDPRGGRTPTCGRIGGASPSDPQPPRCPSRT